jgi:hypothetical protein
MELRQLRYVQSALSQQVQRLEREAGVRPLERSPTSDYPWSVLWRRRLRPRPRRCHLRQGHVERLGWLTPASQTTH